MPAIPPDMPEEPPAQADFPGRPGDDLDGGSIVLARTRLPRLTPSRGKRLVQPSCGSDERSTRPGLSSVDSHITTAGATPGGALGAAARLLAEPYGASTIVTLLLPGTRRS